MDELIREELPELHAKIKEMGEEMGMIKMITISWLLTIFLNQLSHDVAAHIMDAFFYDGARVLFVLALTILKKNQDYILECTDEGRSK